MKCSSSNVTSDVFLVGKETICGPPKVQSGQKSPRVDSVPKQDGRSASEGHLHEGGNVPSCALVYRLSCYIFLTSISLNPTGAEDRETLSLPLSSLFVGNFAQPPRLYVTSISHCV